jgi:hypothetical protein
MFGVRNLDPGRTSTARPGDNRELLCSAPFESAAETIVRALNNHQIDCTTRRRPATQGLSVGGLPWSMSTDIYVQGSDLERARRVVRQSLDAHLSGM